MDLYFILTIWQKFAVEGNTRNNFQRWCLCHRWVNPATIHYNLQAWFCSGCSLPVNLRLWCYCPCLIYRFIWVKLIHAQRQCNKIVNHLYSWCPFPNLTTHVRLRMHLLPPSLLPRLPLSAIGTVSKYDVFSPRLFCKSLYVAIPVTS